MKTHDTEKKRDDAPNGLTASQGQKQATGKTAGAQLPVQQAVMQQAQQAVMRGAGPQPLGPLSQVAPDIAAKVEQSTGVAVGDVPVVLDQGLAKEGKRGVAVGGKEVRISMEGLQNPGTMTEEPMHIAQQRGGAGGGQDPAISAPEAEKEAKGQLGAVSEGASAQASPTDAERLYDDGAEKDQAGGELLLVDDEQSLIDNTSESTEAIAAEYRSAVAEIADKTKFKVKLKKKKDFEAVLEREHQAGAKQYYQEKLADLEKQYNGAGQLIQPGLLSGSEAAEELFVIIAMSEYAARGDLDGLRPPSPEAQAAGENLARGAAVGSGLEPENAFTKLISSQQVYLTTDKLDMRRQQWLKRLNAVWTAAAKNKPDPQEAAELMDGVVGSHDKLDNKALSSVANRDRGSRDSASNATRSHELAQEFMGNKDKAREFRRRTREGAAIVARATEQVEPLDLSHEEIKDALSAIIIAGAQEAQEQYSAMRQVTRSSLFGVSSLRMFSAYRNGDSQEDGFLRGPHRTIEVGSKFVDYMDDKSKKLLKKYRNAVEEYAYSPDGEPNAQSRKQQRKRTEQGKTAPFLSRHHWGTDFDVYEAKVKNDEDDKDTWNERFEEGGKRYDEYEWLSRFARFFGFVQPYQGDPATRIQKESEVPGEAAAAIAEEKWHWSYWPVAQAYVDFLKQHRGAFDGLINARLGSTETKGEEEAGVGKTPDFYSWVKDHWIELHLNVQQDIELPDGIEQSIPDPHILTEQ